VTCVGPPASHDRIPVADPLSLMLWNRDAAVADPWPDSGNGITSLP
jgi:hypothetical protein